MTSLLLAALSALSLQSPACECSADLDSLVSRLEANYVAWHLEVKGKPREAEYRRLVGRLRERAGRTSGADCVFLLRELTGWFHDGHLFIAEFPRMTPDSTASLARAAVRRSVATESEAIALLEARRGRLDPIEGIWYARGLRVAIMPVSGQRGAFEAIVLSAADSGWQPGQVRASFTRQRDGRYRTELFTDERATRHVDAVIYRRVLLAMPPFEWGRAWPLAEHETGMLDPVDPQRPTIRLADEDAVVVSVPSHDPAYRPVLDSLVAQHRAELERRPYLLIDIRGDLGGGSMTTSALVPWLATPTMRPGIGPSGLSMVVASPDNIGYFRRGWNPDSVAERMAAAPGQVIPLMRNEELGMPFPTDSSRPMPRRVGVLMDSGVASAGEAFVLQARRSTKVTLYGSHTWGMIDYQSTQLVRLACRARGLLLGYPMIAASATLPLNGLNAEGIPPDVRVPSSVTDQVSWVLARMRAADR